MRTLPASPSTRRVLPAPPRSRVAAQRQPALLRRLTLTLAQDESRVLECVVDAVTIRCRRGSVWVVLDDGCQDVVLSSQQSYRPVCGDTLRLVALEPCEVELEFAEDLQLQL